MPAGDRFGEPTQRVDGLVEVEVREAAWPAAAPRHQASRTPTASPANSRPLSEVVQGQVVLGVAGRVDRRQRPVGADADLLAVGQHVDAVGGSGVEANVERVEQVAVEPGRPSSPAGSGR